MKYISYPPCDELDIDREAAREGRAVQMVKTECRRNFITKGQAKRKGAERGARGAKARTGLILVSQ